MDQDLFEIHDDWAVEEAIANLGTADAVRLEEAAEDWSRARCSPAGSRT